MTDKERYGFDVEREMRHLKGIVEKNDTLTISSRFTRYLIEQVERVQELEKVIYQDARQGVLEGLYEENHRYREALVFINEELELVLHSNKGLAEKMFYIENSKRKITEALEESE